MARKPAPAQTLPGITSQVERTGGSDKTLAIRYRAVTDLKAAPRNARTHSEAQIRQIAASIREFGFTNPLLIGEDSGIIAGHGRLAAAVLLGMAEVPTILLAGLTAAQRRALLLADNKIALNSGWDEELLALELGELRDMGFDLATVGFDDSELAGILDAGGGRTDPDDAPPVEPVVVAQPGDVWVLGRHRLACGDCTVPQVVQALLQGARPNLMVTDPPYGVEYDADWRNRADRANGKSYGARAVGSVQNDDRADWRAAWRLFPGAVAYVWHAGTQCADVALSLRSAGFVLRAQVVWVKQRLVIGRGDYHHQHEPCFYGVRDPEQEDWHFVPEHEVASYSVRKGQRGDFAGGRKQSTVWFIEHVKSETGHSTQKPVEAMMRPITNNSKPGGLVYDPFLGSGTTVIAAEMSGRVCLAIELNPAYVDVSIRRWSEFTGKRAVLEETGEAFDQVAARRADEVVAEVEAPA